MTFGEKFRRFPAVVRMNIHLENGSSLREDDDGSKWGLQLLLDGSALREDDKGGTCRSD